MAGMGCNELHITGMPAEQWVRHALVKSGDMDGSRRGIWAITEQSRKRLDMSTA